MRYILTIPKPCSENWNQMTPTEKGAFCTSCQKEVIDFSQTGVYLLAQKLSQESSLCGRFKPDQLNRSIVANSRSIWKLHAASLGFTSLVLLSTPVIAQIEKPNIAEMLQYKMPTCGLTTSPAKVSDSMVIKGLVEDSESSMPGAYVMLKGTTIGTQADFDGKFTLTLPGFYKDLEGTLVCTYIGYQTLEIPFNGNAQFIHVKFTEASAEILGELVVVRKMNIFKRIGRWFRNW